MWLLIRSFENIISQSESPLQTSPKHGLDDAQSIAERSDYVGRTWCQLSLGIWGINITRRCPISIRFLNCRYHNRVADHDDDQVHFHRALHCTLQNRTQQRYVLI